MAMSGCTGGDNISGVLVVSVLRHAACLREFLQPVEGADLPIGSTENDSQTVGAATTTQITYETVTSAKPDCHQQPASQYVGGIGHDVMHEAVNADGVEVENKLYDMEQLEDVTRIDSNETNHLASAHEQVYQSSSRQDCHWHVDTPYPWHAPSPDADLSSEEKSEESPDMVKPHQPTPQRLQHHNPSSDGEPGLDGAELNHKSFHYVVNSLVSYKTTLRRSDLTVFIIHNCSIYACCCC